MRSYVFTITIHDEFPKATAVCSATIIDDQNGGNTLTAVGLPCVSVAAAVIAELHEQAAQGGCKILGGLSDGRDVNELGKQPTQASKIDRSPLLVVERNRKARELEALDELDRDPSSAQDRAL